MKIYIAAPFRFGKDLVPKMALALESAGHTITHKWWLTEYPPSREDHTDEMMRGWADGDLLGVEQADLLWVLAEEGGVGTWVEFGYALGVREWPLFLYTRVIVSGPFCTIFTKVRGVTEYATHEDALKTLIRPEAP